jgi:hypothetical protein
MLDFITNSKYRSPTFCVEYQDFIIQKPGINLLEVDSYIRELNRYGFIFQSFLGYNQVPESNIAIRQNIILSTLYYLKKDFEKCKEYKVKADDIFLALKKGWMYMEGFSYLKFVESAYAFHFRNVPLYFAGFIDVETFSMMEKTYRKFASPDNKLPFTDTAFVHELVNEERVTFVNDLYSVHYLNNTKTYVFINHNKYNNDYSKNLHVNFEFGHIAVFNDNEWKMLHPFYAGYDLKQKSMIKESWNNNIIYGSHCNEPLWRYKPNKSTLDWTYDKNVYNLKIGKDITRKIEILENGIFISDSGGEYSSFNVSKNCEVNTYGSKTEQTIGYHSPDYGSVLPHRRIKSFGAHRLFYMEF